MKSRICLLLAAVLTCALPVSDALAAKGGNGGNKGKSPKQSRVRFSMVVATAAADLATATGKMDSKPTNGQTHFKSSIHLPLVAPTLAISDAVTAAAALIYLEVIPSGATEASNVCQFEFKAPDAGEPAATSHHFRIFGKKSGKSNARSGKFPDGSCTNGVIALTATDDVNVYAMVNGLRVEILSK